MDNYVGQILDGRYEIQEIIGVGGMAVVYRAYDNLDDRIVALKILKEEYLANEEFRRRFKNESKAIAVLSHPNIVKVYDVSFGETLQYIVMEYVEGITLKEYIGQQKVLDWREAVHFATQILRALQHAHDKGIVHRDIKPQNIMLLENGTIKVADFGIARFSRSETRTMTESAIGSVHYISPEQAKGDITDDKADIYSVGVVLYEMITGTLPFEGENAVSVALKQLQEQAEAPRKINPSIPEGLEQITLHAMEKTPRNRYQSAAEMLLDLDELKRNPSVKFDYTFEVDEPTKFISKESATGTVPDLGATRILPEGELPETPEPGAAGEKKKRAINRRTMWLGIGIGALVVIIIVLMVYLFTSGILGGERVTVPDFVGKNYYTEVDGNDKYSDFEFELTFVSSSTSAAGQILTQDRSPGSKVRSGSTIQLEIVSNGTAATVPNINGKSLASAEEALKDVGFLHFNIVTQSNTKYAANTVIRSDPAQGSKADTSDTIILYVAASSDSAQVVVPDFTGLNYRGETERVQDYFTSVGLTLGSVTEVDSAKPQGTILSQSIPKDSQVAKGTTVDITISSGKSGNSTATLTITLPNTGKEGTVTTYMNNNAIKTEKVTLNGKNHSVKIRGSDSGVPVSVYVNGNKAYDATVDFSKNPAAVSGEHHYTVSG